MKGARVGRGFLADTLGWKNLNPLKEKYSGS